MSLPGALLYNADVDLHPALLHTTTDGWRHCGSLSHTVFSPPSSWFADGRLLDDALRRMGSSPAADVNGMLVALPHDRRRA